MLEKREKKTSKLLGARQGKEDSRFLDNEKEKQLIYDLKISGSHFLGIL